MNKANPGSFVGKNHLFGPKHTKPPSAKSPIASPLYDVMAVSIFPAITALGQIGLSLLGQSILLTSAPSMILLASVATCAALLTYPFFAMARAAIEKNCSEKDWKTDVSYTLLYLSCFLLNIHLAAYFAALAGHHMMTIYALYAIYGVGFVPALLSCIALVLIAKNLCDLMSYNYSPIIQGQSAGHEGRLTPISEHPSEDDLSSGGVAPTRLCPMPHGPF